MNAQEKAQFLLARRLSNGPSIIIVRGVAYITIGGRTSVLTKSGHNSQKHGFVFLLYAEESWGVLGHNTVNAREHIFFIPPKKRINVSNGRFELMDVNYDSFVQAHDQGTMLHPISGNININQVVGVGKVCGTVGNHSVMIMVTGGGLEEMKIPGRFKEVFDFYLVNSGKKAYKINCVKCLGTFWSLLDSRRIHPNVMYCTKCSVDRVNP